MGIRPESKPLSKGLAALVLFAALAGPAQAARVAVLVVPPFDPAVYAQRGAVGLFVPGSGETASRKAALASLVRGKVEPSTLGGVPSGKPLISLARRPAAVTIYVALPPPGKHANTKRYPVAIVGGGYHGILVSRSTRIRGLVSIADIADGERTRRGQAAGDPRPRRRPGGNAPRSAQLANDAHAPRPAVGDPDPGRLRVGGALLAVGFRSPYLGRAGVLAAPGVLAASLMLSALGVSKVSTVVLLLAALTVGGALLVGSPRPLLPWALVALVVAYLVVFTAWPEVNSLAAIGARPDGGGRFYGAGNLTETVLLTVSLAAAALLGRRAILPILALTLLTVGWSRAGADGGGIVVLLVAFGVLAARMYRVRPTPRRVGLAFAAACLAVAALVGLDAVTGGSSHVTRAFRTGPVSLAEELGHRIHISAASIGSGWSEAAVFAVSIAALVVLATRRPHFPAGDALLAGVAVSLLVNDSPGDVASAGALSYAVLWAYERVREPARERTAADSVPRNAQSVSPRA
jgi:hypothetical protein